MPDMLDALKAAADEAVAANNLPVVAETTAKMIRESYAAPRPTIYEAILGYGQALKDSPEYCEVVLDAASIALHRAPPARIKEATTLLFTTAEAMKDSHSYEVANVMLGIIHRNSRTHPTAIAALDMLKEVVPAISKKEGAEKAAYIIEALQQVAWRDANPFPLFLQPCAVLHEVQPKAATP